MEKVDEEVRGNILVYSGLREENVSLEFSHVIADDGLRQSDPQVLARSSLDSFGRVFKKLTWSRLRAQRKVRI